MDENQELEKEQGPSLDANDDAVLSPTSKKVLEHCAVRISASPGKEFRPLIARPSSSGTAETFGFHFARRSNPLPNFSARPQPKSTRAAGGVEGKLESHINGEKNAVADAVPALKHSDATPPVITRQENTGDGARAASTYLSPEPTQSLTTSSKGPEAIIVDSQQGSTGGEVSEPAPQRGSTKDPVVREINFDSGTQPPGPVCQSSRATSASSNDGTLEKSIRKFNMNRQLSSDEQSARSPSTSMSPPFKVTKQRASRPNSSVNKMISGSHNTSAQPSEEDLFYLLIHRLKRRDQAEAATAALKEEMEERLRKANQENEVLKGQLKQAETRHTAHETERATQRNLIERWKVKFNKLRNLMVTIGNGHEILRKDGRLLKSVQAALVQENHHLQLDVKQLGNNTSEINKSISQHNIEFFSMKSEIVALKNSLLLIDNKLKNSEVSLARERNRTATLEAYIRSNSSRGLKQLSSFQHIHAETSSRIESLCKGIKDFIAISQSTMETEFGSSLKACLDMLGKFSAREESGAVALTKVDSALRDIASKLDECGQTSTQSLTEGFSQQNQRASQIMQQLVDINASLESSFEAANQLAEARETNGQLQEKLSNAQKAQAEAEAAHANLKQREMHLSENSKSLQEEIRDLQTRLVDASRLARDNNELSNMQMQLESTSMELSNAKEALAAKESTVITLEAKVEEMKCGLDNAMVQISTFENEKGRFKEEMKAVENRMRAEFTRASLLSKEQDRALFEQQLHQLKREKAVAEKSVDTLKEQLEILRSELTLSESSRTQLETLVADGQKETEVAREVQQQGLANMKKAMSELQAKHASDLKELEDLRHKLEEALGENERLRSEISKVQSTMDNSNQVSLLQEQFDIMRVECVQKDETIASLTNERAALQNRLKEVDILRAEVAQKSSEIEKLGAKVEEVESRNAELADLLSHKDDDVACLTAELELFKLGDLQKSAQEKDDELQKLQAGFQGVESSLAKAENLLRQYSLLDENQPLLQSWDILEKRLASFIHRGEPSEMLLDVDDNINGGPSLEPKHAGKRKRTANITPRVNKHISPRCSTREYKTTKVIYHKESIRRSISCSPLKASKRPGSRRKQADMTTPRIKPFSQVQWDLKSQQNSPSQEIGLTDNLLSAPMENSLKFTDLAPPSTPKVQKANSDILSLELPRSPVKDPRVESHMMEREHAGEASHQAQGESVFAQTDLLVKSSQTKPDKTPLRGILKETVMPGILSQEIRKVHQTPPTEDILNNKGPRQPAAPRRQSRTSSHYFNSIDNADSVLSSSRQTWAVTKSTDTAVGHSRPRRYGKKKGDLYNNRFKQDCPK